MMPMYWRMRSLMGFPGKRMLSIWQTLDMDFGKDISHHIVQFAIIFESSHVHISNLKPRRSCSIFNMLSYETLLKEHLVYCVDVSEYSIQLQNTISTFSHNLFLSYVPCITSFAIGQMVKMMNFIGSWICLLGVVTRVGRKPYQEEVRRVNYLQIGWIQGK